MNNNNQFDCCIVGGGMVGAALAVGLAKQNKSVVLLEQHDLHTFDFSQPPDLRMSAFNMHSVKLLQELGAWSFLEKMRLRPYSKLSVWDGAPFISGNDLNYTSFDASEVNESILGYFIENRLVQLALHEVLTKHYSEQVALVYGQNVQNIDCIEGKVELENGNVYSAPVVFGADGAQSKVRQSAGISTSGWQYSQHANGILIETEEPVAGETWQAFYPSGPRALLPMFDNFSCLIWYDSLEQTNWITKANNDDLKASIITHFPNKLADFNIVSKANFGLTRMHAKKYGQHKAIILGDAAHTINPLAGQGVNIGFKDVACLIELIQDQGLQNLSALVRAYEKQRYHQNLLMMSTMDALYFTFSSNALPLKAIRDIGLTLAQRAGVVKQQALKYAMGLS